MKYRATTLVVCMLVACAGLIAQTSQIQGTVKDSSGAAVPGATVKATANRHRGRPQRN